MTVTREQEMTVKREREMTVKRNMCERKNPKGNGEWEIR